MGEQKEEMSFLDHLEVLRWHLVRSVVAIILFSVLGFIFSHVIFNSVLLAPSKSNFITYQLLSDFSEFIGAGELQFKALSKLENLAAFDLTAQLLAYIKFSLYTGFILASPYIIWEFFRFVKPALHANENRIANILMFFASILFFFGLLFGYYFVAPLSIHFLASFSISEQIDLWIKFDNILSIVSTICFANGLLFELPILAYFLSRIGLITPEIMRKYRKHAIVLILILSAIITPPDIFSQILITFPLMILYELSIKISARVINNQEKKKI